MKKLFLFLAISLASFTIKAQEFGLGISAGYLTEIESIGAGLDFNYDFNEKWGIAAAGTFTAKENNGIRNKWLALDLNGRYYIVNKLYAFAGGEYLQITVKELGLGGGTIGGDSSLTDSEFGVNLGTGYRYNLVDNVNLFAEVKYVLVDAGYVHAKAGIHFSFR